MVTNWKGSILRHLFFRWIFLGLVLSVSSEHLFGHEGYLFFQHAQDDESIGILLDLDPLPYVTEHYEMRFSQEQIIRLVDDRLSRVSFSNLKEPNGSLSQEKGLDDQIPSFPSFEDREFQTMIGQRVAYDSSLVPEFVPTSYFRRSKESVVKVSDFKKFNIVFSDCFEQNARNFIQMQKVYTRDGNLFMVQNLIANLHAMLYDVRAVFMHDSKSVNAYFSYQLFVNDFCALIEVSNLSENYVEGNIKLNTDIFVCYQEDFNEILKENLSENVTYFIVKPMLKNFCAYQDDFYNLLGSNLSNIEIYNVEQGISKKELMELFHRLATNVIENKDEKIDQFSLRMIEINDVFNQLYSFEQENIDSNSNDFDDESPDFSDSSDQESNMIAYFNGGFVKSWAHQLEKLELKKLYSKNERDTASNIIANMRKEAKANVASTWDYSGHVFKIEDGNMLYNAYNNMSDVVKYFNQDEKNYYGHGKYRVYHVFGDIPFEKNYMMQRLVSLFYEELRVLAYGLKITEVLRGFARSGKYIQLQPNNDNKYYPGKDFLQLHNNLLNLFRSHTVKGHAASYSPYSRLRYEDFENSEIKSDVSVQPPSSVRSFQSISFRKIPVYVLVYHHLKQK